MSNKKEIAKLAREIEEIKASLGKRSADMDDKVAGKLLADLQKQITLFSKLVAKAPTDADGVEGVLDVAQNIKDWFDSNHSRIVKFYESKK